MIIKNPKDILTNQYGKEILENELLNSGFSVNQGSINDFSTKKIEPHWHQEFELFVLDSGKAEANLEGETVVLEKNSGCFINRNVLHSFISVTAEECNYRSFVFGADIVTGFDGSIFDSKYVTPLLQSGVPYLIFDALNNPAFFEYFHAAFEACKYEESGYEFQLRFSLSEIILYCLKRASSFKVSDKNNLLSERIKSMMIWIDQNLENEISLKAIAAQSNVCVRECQRIFSQCLNYSPMEYVRKRRIIAASRFLVKTELPIVEIANNLQFSSSSHFSKLFKEIMGCTPLQYRKQSHKN